MRNAARSLLLAAAAILLIPAASAQDAPGLTLTPTRTLDLTTHEATWMQLDLSPDGRTILFDLLGDIYALDAKGGLDPLLA